MGPASRLPPIRGDRERVEQVLRNLVDNAIKYTPTGGQVLVHGQAERTGSSLTVEDTGAGIPADQLATIFDEFVRLRRAPARGAPGGSGLGLPICRRIVRALGGQHRGREQRGSGVGLHGLPAALARSPDSARSDPGPAPYLARTAR